MAGAPAREPADQPRVAGLDVLVFTGGVGERSAAIRTATARGLAFVGVAVDARRDAAAEPDADVSTADAAVRTLVVAAREDLEIAREVRAVLAPGGAGPPQ
jgi:acetate kinase